MADRLGRKTKDLSVKKRNITEEETDGLQTKRD
jgi:hypothetical protein